MMSVRNQLAMCAALVTGVAMAEGTEAYWAAQSDSATWADAVWRATADMDAEAISFADGMVAVLGAVDGASSNGMVNAAVTAGGITVVSGTNTLAGTGSLALAGSGVVDVAEGALLQDDVAFAGTTPWTKTGKGTLVLGGSSGAYAPSGPLVIREGLVRLTKQKPDSIGAYSPGPFAVTVESGGTLDLYGAYWDSSPYNLNVTIAGDGHDGKGALIDTGMIDQYNKYLSTITLADDATVRAVGQFYVSTIETRGHALTKTGGQQFCISDLKGDGDLCIKEGSVTAFRPSSLGNAVGKTRFIGNGTGIGFWQGNTTYTEPIVVSDNASMSINGSGNAYRKMVWKGPIQIDAGKSLTLRPGNDAHTLMCWELATDVTGTGSLIFQALTNYLTVTSLTFPGTVTVNGNKNLYVGRRGATAGTLGTVGALRNEGWLVPLRDGEMAFSRRVYGSGTFCVAASNKVVVQNTSFTNIVRVQCGEMTFDNVVGYIGGLYVGEVKTVPFVESVNDVVGVVNITGDSDLQIGSLQVGNGNVSGGQGVTAISGVVNQVSGRVTAVNAAGDSDALHLGHWPLGRSVYNMMGGTLTVRNPDYRISVAVDGRGVFNLSGGAVYTQEFCLNVRDGTVGHGTLNLTGGDLYLGGRGMTAGGGGAPYVANFAGGTIRAWNTNTAIKVDAALDGASTVFDTSTGAISVDGVLSGAGGFRKTGDGTLTLTQPNTFTGVGCVLAGVLDLAGRTVTSGRFAGTGTVQNGVIGPGATLAGGEDGEGALNVAETVSFAAGGALGLTVAADGASCGCAVFAGAVPAALAGVKVTVANPELLDTKKKYVFARCANGFAGALDQSALPDGWHVIRSGSELVLDGNCGTCVILH